MPDQVRTNDWWPAEVVEQWRAQAAAHADKRPPPPTFDGEQRVREAMARYTDDPFQGATQRRRMPEGMLAADMEVAAAREAITRADIDPAAIDFVILQSSVPDILTTNGACTIHETLGLRRTCLALTIDAVCNGFQQQMTLADALIGVGQAERGLLVQSCTLSRVVPDEDPVSAWVGDGATAQIVTAVGGDRGLLGFAHETDGSLQRGLITGVPGHQWFDEGRVIAYREHPQRAREMLLRLAEFARSSVHAALEHAALTTTEVDFYASHQPFAWFRPVTQAHAELDHARTLDTYSWAGSLSAANIPLVLATAEREGLLNPGDVVATHAGGSGITWASLVIRWGT